MTYNHEVYKKYVFFCRRCVILDKSWRWQNTGVPWLSCRNEMPDPVVVELHVWRGEDGRGVETGELWQGRQVSQDKSSGLAEFWCKFPEIVSESITLSFNTTTYLNVKWRLLLLLLVKKWWSIFVWNSQGAVFYAHRSGSETNWQNWIFVITKMVRYIQNLIWHLRDACDRTKRNFLSLSTKPSSTISSPRKDSPSVRLHRSTRSVQRNWKR